MSNGFGSHEMYHIDKVLEETILSRPKDSSICIFQYFTWASV